jgi:hypothetical protein
VNSAENWIPAVATGAAFFMIVLDIDRELGLRAHRD